MDPDTQNDLEEIKASVLRELDGIDAIYLFGSIARGTAGASSDYDIAVILQRCPTDYIRKISAIRYALLGTIRRPLDLILLDYEDLATPSPIVYEIGKVNRLLFGRDVLVQVPGTGRNVRPIIRDGATIGYHV